MPRFNLQRFLAGSGLSIARLASYHQVAQTYLQQVAAGKADLTRRDREACRTLWRRLTQAVQIELPFAEPPSAFTREHARLLARARGTGAAGGTPRRPGPASRKPTPDRTARPKGRRGWTPGGSARKRKGTSS